MELLLMLVLPVMATFMIGIIMHDIVVLAFNLDAEYEMDFFYQIEERIKK